jgi:hypothetical protein
LNVVGFDARIERRPHESAAACIIKPNVLVARQRGAKIHLGYGIKPAGLQ